MYKTSVYTLVNGVSDSKNQKKVISLTITTLNL